MNWQMNIVLPSSYDESPQFFPVLPKLIEFLGQFVRSIFQVGDTVDDVLMNELLQHRFLFGLILIRFEQLELLVHLLVVHFQQWD